MRKALTLLAAGALILSMSACTPDKEKPSPTPSPTPTATQSPTVAPTKTPTPTSTPTPKALVTVDTSKLLPVARPLTEGLLASTDSNWKMLFYQGYSDAYDTTDNIDTANQNYLMSPEGELYQLPKTAEGYISQWLPGTPYAVVFNGYVPNGDGAPGVWVENLENGEHVLDIDMVGLAAQYDITDGWGQAAFVGDNTTDLLVGVSDDTTFHLKRINLKGEPLVEASYEAGYYNVSPDGRLMAYVGAGEKQRIINTRTLQEVGTPGVTCSPGRWINNDELLTFCLDEEGAETWEVTNVNGQSGTIETSDNTYLNLVGKLNGAALLESNVYEGDKIGLNLYTYKDLQLTKVETPLKTVLVTSDNRILGSETPQEDNFYGGVSGQLKLYDPANGEMTAVTSELKAPAWSTVFMILSGAGEQFGGLIFTDGKLDIYVD